MTEVHPIPKVKILSLGECKVGKSSIIERFVGGKFSTHYTPTIGIDLGERQFPVDNIQILVHFWDLSGDDSYFEVRNEFYGDADGYALVFDLTDRSSYNQLSKWVDECKRYGADLSTGIILGNKNDSPKIAISNEEASQFARRLGMQYMDVSAKTGSKVEDAYSRLLQVVTAKIRKHQSQK